MSKFITNKLQPKKVKTMTIDETRPFTKVADKQTVSSIAKTKKSLSRNNSQSSLKLGL